MSYLLDTNVLLWVMENNPLLTQKAKDIIVNRENDIYVSIACFWEISIKLSIGKLDLTRSLDEIIRAIEPLGFTLLPISLDAVRLIRNMPFHHRDPFDRLIIAQAQALDITIITKDRKFESYNVKVLW